MNYESQWTGLIEDIAVGKIGKLQNKSKKVSRLQYRKKKTENMKEKKHREWNENPYHQSGQNSRRKRENGATATF